MTMKLMFESAVTARHWEDSKQRMHIKKVESVQHSCLSFTSLDMNPRLSTIKHIK